MKHLMGRAVATALSFQTAKVGAIQTAAVLVSNRWYCISLPQVQQHAHSKARTSNMNMNVLS